MGVSSVPGSHSVLIHFVKRLWVWRLFPRIFERVLVRGGIIRILLDMVGIGVELAVVHGDFPARSLGTPKLQDA